MVLDIILGLAFLGSLFVLWYRVSQKIPELVLVPDTIIAERLKEDSAKVRFFILHIKTFYKEQHYKTLFFNFLGKTLHKSHIGLMKIDNLIVGYHKKVKANGKEIEKAEKEEAVAVSVQMLQPAEIITTVVPAVSEIQSEIQLVEMPHASAKIGRMVEEVRPASPKKKRTAKPKAPKIITASASIYTVAEKKPKKV